MSYFETDISFKDPNPSTVGKEYFELCNRGILAAQRCQDCSALRRYLTTVCPKCGKTEYEWEELSGVGETYSFTMSYTPMSAEFADDVPYIVALIDLREGIRMMSNIVEHEGVDVGIGTPVELTWRRTSDRTNLPMFRPNTAV